jgi:hypothetical protein
LTARTPSEQNITNTPRFQINSFPAPFAFPPIFHSKPVHLRNAHPFPFRTAVESSLRLNSEQALVARTLQALQAQQAERVLSSLAHGSRTTSISAQWRAGAAENGLSAEESLTATPRALLHANARIAFAEERKAVQAASELAKANARGCSRGDVRQWQAAREVADQRQLAQVEIAEEVTEDWEASSPAAAEEAAEETIQEAGDGVEETVHDWEEAVEEWLWCWSWGCEGEWCQGGDGDDASELHCE